MARRTAMTVAMAVVLGLGILAGVGRALPEEQMRTGREALRQAGQSRAELTFATRWEQIAERGHAPAQPVAFCEACISAAAGRGLDCAKARGCCAAACGLE